MGFRTVQTAWSFWSTCIRSARAAKGPANTATIVISSPTSHRHRGESRRPSGKVWRRAKIGKMSTSQDQLVAHSTTQSEGSTCVGGGSRLTSHDPAIASTGSTSPGNISSHPTTLRGCLATMMAPDSRNAAIATACQRAARTLPTAVSGPAPSTVIQIESPMVTSPTRVIPQTMRADRSGAGGRRGLIAFDPAPVIAAFPRPQPDREPGRRDSRTRGPCQVTGDAGCGPRHSRPRSGRSQIDRLRGATVAFVVAARSEVTADMSVSARSLPAKASAVRSAS